MIHYGKAEVSVYRTDGVRELLGAEIELDVFGENFMPAYTEGDNRQVVATDSMKNFIHVTALEYDEPSLEGLCEEIGRRFLDKYGHVEHVRIRARELPFSRQSDVLFQRTYDDAAFAEVDVDRTGVLGERSGRLGLHLIKITGSSFAEFARDEYTTLPERTDRPLFIHLDTWWRHVDRDRRVASTDVRDALAETFDDFNSRSIQHLVHEMGARLLARFPEIAEVSFEAQNRLWDTAQVSEEDERVTVYTDPRPPYGMIGLTLER